MSFTVQDVYRPVCNVLCEPGGLTLGLTTEAAFCDYFVQVLTDFLQRTRLIQRLFVNQTQSGSYKYEKPEWIMDIDQVFYDEIAVQRTTEGDVEFLQPSTRSEQGMPKAWRNDRSSKDVYAVYPAPYLEGRDFKVSPSGCFGVIAAVRDVVDIDIVMAPGRTGYGTIAGESGSIFLQEAGMGFGTIAGLRASNANISGSGPAGPFRKTVTVSELVDTIPKTFWPYLKFGVLAQIFTEDGEHKDPLRAKVCAARYEEGVQLGMAVMGAMGDE